MWNRLKKFFVKGEATPVSSNPEDAYIVTITDEYVKVEHPRRKTESIQWKNIEEIWLVNTDDGPFLPDVFLLLTGNNEGCIIPQGTKGCDEVYDIVSKYDNFSFENVIASMTCTDNQRFVLWKRKAE